MKRAVLAFLIGVGAVMVQPAFPQAASSTSLVGAVTDRTGAVIPGASVSAVQDATKVVYKGQTNGRGIYTIPYVAVGTYTVTVTASGFGTAVHNNVLVGVNQTVRADFSLQVGSQNAVVTVSSTPPPIATDDAALQQTTGTAAIASLPIPDHDTFKLALTAPGVQQYDNSSVGDPPGESFSGPGTAGEQNDITLDGVTIMNSIHTTTDFLPAPAAIQELSVQTGTYSAQYGNYLGVHINAVTKAGGNSLHGTLTEAVRNNVFDAHGFFDKPGVPKNPLRHNQFAAELDGPVVIPGVYNGRNKTFFMFAYSGQREYSKSTQIATVMTAQERGGDFSELLTAAKPTVLSDPVDNTCIINNVIQARCIDPHALEYLNFMPAAPNLSGLKNNLSASPSSGNNWNQYIGRVDETLNSNSRVYFRYAYQKANAFTGALFAPDSSYTPSTQHNFVVGYTQVVTPNLVNELLVGRNGVALNSANGYFVNPALQSQLKVLTIPGYDNPPGNPGDPSVSMSGYAGLGSGARNSLQTDEVWTTTDSLTWIHGAHTFIFGGDISRVHTTRFAANSPRGSFAFDGSMTGDAAADFMRGLLVADTTPTVQLGSAGLQWRYDGFIVDNWNVTPKLTLNLGVRYELPTVPVSPSGYANVLSPDGTKLIPPSATVADAKPFYHYTLPNHKQWAPRFGFAYRVTPEWVVRGGVGVYFSPNSMNDVTILSLNPPFGSNFSFNTNRANPVMTFSDPNPASALGSASPTPDVVTIGPAFPSASMNQWSFDIERSLWSGAGLDVQYLGNHTDHLAVTWQRNAPLPGPGSVQSRRPNRLWGNIRDINNNGWSNYNGMNIVLTQRMHRGVSLQLSYTWSHELDLGPFSETGAASIVNPYDWRSDYGNSNDDIRHRVVASYVWQMPFFQNGAKDLLSSVAGGWSLSGTAAIETGSPVNVTSGKDVANTGQGSQRPNLVGDINPRCGELLTACFNAGAFAQPAQYNYGNAGRNLFYGPGDTVFNTSLAKTFRLGERYDFQIRADAFNTFNHVNFGNPSGNMSSRSFGDITSAGPMRVIEIAGRLSF